MRHKECAFAKCTQGSNEKRHLLTIFKAARNTFDKSLRNAERAHRRDLSINIETACTDNPRQFWGHLRSLGPMRKHEIPLEVYDDQGNIISEYSTNGRTNFRHCITLNVQMISLINNFMTEFYSINVCLRTICLTLYTKKMYY